MAEEPREGAAPTRTFLGPLALGLLALGGGAASLWFWRTDLQDPGTPMDDAFMFLRYADHFLAGHGHAWNPDGVQTYGSTSLLYFAAVLAARAWSTLADVDLLRTLSFGFGLCVVPVLILAAWRSFRAAGVAGGAGLAALVTAPIFLCDTAFLYHSRSGMDTTLAALTVALVGAATLWAVRRDSRLSLAAAVTAAFLAWQARPDTLLLAGGMPLLAFLFASPRDRRWRRALGFGGAFGALLGLDALCKTWWFGVPLPLPVYAKAHGYEDYAGVLRWNPLALFLDYLGMALPFLAVLILCAGRRHRALVLSCVIPVVLTAAVLSQMSQIMGYRGRFYVPTIPLLALAALLALQGLLSEVRAGTWSPRGLPLRLGVVFLLVGLLAPAQKDLVPRYADWMRGRSDVRPARETSNLPRIKYEECVQRMSALARGLPEGSVLCMSEYGAIGAEAPEVTILDPLGLHDRETARKGFSAERLLSQQPDLIWMPHTDYAAMHDQLKQAIRASGDFDYYPGAFLYGVAVRRSGPRAEEVSRRFARVWSRSYPDHPIEQAQRGD